MTGACRELAQRRNLDQLGGDLAQALLEAGLARLPADSAEPVELRAVLGRAVAGQQLDVLDRQVQLVAARIGELQAVVRGAQRRDGGEPVEAADAVVGVHHEVADARLVASVMTSAARRALRRGRTSRSPRMSCSAITASSARLEALLEAEHGERRLVGRQRQRLGVAVDLARVVSPCSASSVASRSRAPAVKAAMITRRPWPCRSRTCPTAASNTLVSRRGALGGEVAPGAAAGTSAPRRRGIGRLLERRQAAHRAPASSCVPSLVPRNMRVRRHRLVGRRAEGLRLLPSTRAS